MHVYRKTTRKLRGGLESLPERQNEAVNICDDCYNDMKALEYTR